jgi:hypothetical protein
MTSEVTELIAALRSGHMTLDQVAERFRQRSWPDAASPEPESYQDGAARALDDPDPYVPGSFMDVLAAFDRHDLTLDEYEVLAEAAAEGMEKPGRHRAVPGVANGEQPATGD